MDNSYCTSNGWHRTDNGYNYWFSLRPNDCILNTGFDGWSWRYDGSCLGCLWIEYRCHDGWLTICTDACWSSTTICRWIIGCGQV